MVTKSTEGLPKEGATMKQTEKNVEFAKGGKTKMFGEQGAEPQMEGESGHSTGNDQGPPADHGGGPVVGDKFAKGGSTKMFGYAGSQPAEAGKTSAR